MYRAESDSGWRLQGKVLALPGYAHGSSYPVLILSFEGRPLSDEARKQLWDCFLDACPLLVHPDQVRQQLNWQESAEWLLAGWQALQLGCGLPVYETGRVLVASATQVRCLVPGLKVSQRALAVVVGRTLEFLEQISAGDGVTEKTRLLQAIKALCIFSPKGSNVPRFVKAAHALGLPFGEIPGGVYQYGVAKCARWLDSSFTDVTPKISARLSRSKASASSLLRQAGLPVPKHYLVANIKNALQAAHQLGYPVVVKPENLDGGVGVAAGLESDDEVQQAFDSAQKYSKQILVEKHVEGRDYRVLVFNGEVIWAIERVPGGVMGDGIRTVTELTDQVNADPRRGTDNHAPLKRLLLDEEAHRLLERQGMNENSVPDKECFVRFRRAANVAAGGTPVAVFDRIHPDNARLAVRAAQVLGLDLAGIDLLIPDIAISWHETGAAICEVNGQPNLGQTTSAHLYPQILKKLVPGSGRVPTILLLGTVKIDKWQAALSNRLAHWGLRVGVAGLRQVSIEGETIHSGSVSPYAGGQMLLLSRQVDAMVIAVGDDSILRTGLPVARYDALLIADAHLNSSVATVPSTGPHLINEMLLNLLPACDGAVITLASGIVKMQGLNDLTTAAWYPLDGDIAWVAEETVRLVQECVAQRESRFAAAPS